MMTRRFSLQYSILSLVFLTVVWLGAQPARGAETQLKGKTELCAEPS